MHANVDVGAPHGGELLLEGHLGQVDRLPGQHVALAHHILQLVLVDQDASDILLRRALTYTEGEVRDRGRREGPETVRTEHPPRVGAPERRAPAPHWLLLLEVERDAFVHVGRGRLEVEDEVVECEHPVPQLGQALAVQHWSPSPKGARKHLSVRVQWQLVPDEDLHEVGVESQRPVGHFHVHEVG